MTTPTGLPLPPAPTAAEIEAAKFAADWNPNLTFEQQATAPPKEPFVPAAPTGVSAKKIFGAFEKNVVEILETPDKSRNTNWSELRAEQQAARDAEKGKPAEDDAWKKLWNATLPRRSRRSTTDVFAGPVNWSPSDR